MRYVAGWNMPGYLPEDEPYTHDTFEEAKADIIEELNRAADDYGDEDEQRRIPYELAIAEFEAATEPRTVMVGNYAWWIEPSEADGEDVTGVNDALAPAENDENGECIHCGRDNRGYEGQPCSDDCPLYHEVAATRDHD